MKKEEFKSELKGKVLLNSFFNEEGNLVLLELEENESLNDNLNRFVKDLEAVYNIKKIEFISVKILGVKKEETSIFPIYKITYEIILHFNIGVTISSIKTEKINFYAYESEINFIQ